MPPATELHAADRDGLVDLSKYSPRSRGWPSAEPPAGRTRESCTPRRTRSCSYVTIDDEVRWAQVPLPCRSASWPMTSVGAPDRQAPLRRRCALRRADLVGDGSSVMRSGRTLQVYSLSFAVLGSACDVHYAERSTKTRTERASTFRRTSIKPQLPRARHCVPCSHKQLEPGTLVRPEMSADPIPRRYRAPTSCSARGARKC